MNFKTLKIGRGETTVEIKKFAFFGKIGIFQIKSQTSVLSVVNSEYRVLLTDKIKNFARPIF